MHDALLDSNAFVSLQNWIGAGAPSHEEQMRRKEQFFLWYVEEALDFGVDESGLLTMCRAVTVDAYRGVHVPTDMVERAYQTFTHDIRDYATGGDSREVTLENIKWWDELLSAFAAFDGWRAENTPATRDAYAHKRGYASFDHWHEAGPPSDDLDTIAAWQREIMDAEVLA
jgi:hypothetical protein